MNRYRLSFQSNDRFDRASGDHLFRRQSRLGRWLEHALGAAAQPDPAIGEGRVAKIIAVIMIIVTGLIARLRRYVGRLPQAIQIVFGLSIAFAASSFFLSFFSFGGGVLI